MSKTDFWVDTHAHIYSKEFDADRAEVLRRSGELGVSKIYMPNVDHTTIDAMFEAEQKFSDQCIAMIGLHPCSVKKDFEKELYEVEAWLSRRQFVAIGEMGTDLYWDKSFWSEQQEAFKIQVGWAKKFNLPIIIHCRESMDETIELLAPLADGKLKGVFHCFTGSLEQAQRITSLGFYLGIGGVSTFKNGGLDKVIPELDFSRIVLETDSPYLAPTPHRGKRNTPEFIPLIGERVATLRQIPVEELKSISTANSNRLFSNK